MRLVGVLDEQDEPAMVTRVFAAYLKLVRKLQKVYRLEPAGSKGVWGLDDHQHLVYIWGASQLKSELALSLSRLPHLLRFLFLYHIFAKVDRLTMLTACAHPLLQRMLLSDHLLS